MEAHSVSRGMAQVVVTALFFGLLSCGGGSDMSSPTLVIPGGSFIPDFSFVWQNTADHTNSYQFVSDSTGASGNLTNDSSETLNGVRSTLTGTYSNHTMTVVIERASGKVTASGGFTDADTIKLQFGSTIVTLVRVKL